MKDLYRKLGIPRDASVAELTSALQDHQEQKDIGPILLDERKRAEYDRTHAALMAIGDLRHRLALDSDYAWFEKNYADFSSKKILAELSAAHPQSPSQESPNQAVNESGQTQPVKSKASSRSRHLPVFIVILVIIAVALAYVWL